MATTGACTHYGADRYAYSYSSSIKRFAIIAVAVTTGAATIALAGAFAVSAGARGHSTECNASFSNTTLKGGVVVNSGDTCTLNNVVIHGGLTVTGGRFSVNNSTIGGGWTITGGTGVGAPALQCANNINGGLRVMNTSGSRAVFRFGEKDHGCAGGRIDGGVRFVNDSNAYLLELDGYQVNGGIVDTGNTGFSNEIENDTVHGSATCADNNYVHGGSTALNNGDGGTDTYTGKNTGCPTTRNG